jgi:hypothetical protein
MVDVDAWLSGVRGDPRLGPGTRRAAQELARAWRSGAIAVVEQRALACLRLHSWIRTDRLVTMMSRSGWREARAWSGAWRDHPRDRTRIRTVDLAG